MKLANRNIVTSNLTGKVTDFDLCMDNVGHITQILRKQIYTEHDLAVLREYLTNALDEHTKHSILQPVDITLPALSNEYTFSVRDYAKGLSSQDVETLYTKYGASTKRESNTQAGCLGIGCKAAFAYGDTFYIQSYHDNHRHEYMAALSNSTGQLHHISSERIPTHIPHGLKISVPIKESDVLTFINKTIKYLNYVDPKRFNITNLDTIVNKPDFVHTKDVRLLESDDTCLYPWQFYVDNPMSTNNAVIVMGNVPYPITASNIPEYNDYLQNPKLVLHAPLGSLSIAANREQLQYDDRTVLTLQEINKDISQTIIERVQSEISKAINYDYALKIFYKAQKATDPNTRNSYLSNSRLWNNLPNYTWNERQLVTQDPCDAQYAYMHHCRKTAHSRADNPAYTWESTNRTYSSSKGPTLVSTDGKPNKIILWNPDTHSEGRMKQLVAHHHRKEDKAQPDDEYNVWWVVSPHDKLNYKQLKTHFSYYGNCILEVENLSSIPRSAPQIRSSNSDGSEGIWRSAPKTLCIIDGSASTQHDRLIRLDTNDDTFESLAPHTVHKIDKENNNHIYNEIRLAFPYKASKLLYPSGELYPYQTEGIGNYDNDSSTYRGYYNCDLTGALHSMDPTLVFNKQKDSSRIQYYGLPSNRKLNENFIWFDDYFLELFNNHSKNKEFKLMLCWHEMDYDVTKKLIEHPLFDHFNDSKFATSASPLIRKIHTFEQAVNLNSRQKSLLDVTKRLRIKTNVKSDLIDIDKWIRIYNQVLEKLPLSYHVLNTKSHYSTDKYLREHGLEDHFETQLNKYFKLKPQEDKQD